MVHTNKSGCGDWRGMRKKKEAFEKKEKKNSRVNAARVYNLNDVRGRRSCVPAFFGIESIGKETPEDCSAYIAIKLEARDAAFVSTTLLTTMMATAPAASAFCAST